MQGETAGAVPESERDRRVSRGVEVDAVLPHLRVPNGMSLTRRWFASVISGLRAL